MDPFLIKATIAFNLMVSDSRRQVGGARRTSVPALPLQAPTQHMRTASVRVRSVTSGQTAPARPKRSTLLTDSASRFRSVDISESSHHRRSRSARLPQERRAWTANANFRTRLASLDSSASSERRQSIAEVSPVSPMRRSLRSPSTDEGRRLPLSRKLTIQGQREDRELLPPLHESPESEDKGLTASLEEDTPTPLKLVDDEEIIAERKSEEQEDAEEEQENVVHSSVVSRPSSMAIFPATSCSIVNGKVINTSVLAHESICPVSTSFKERLRAQYYGDESRESTLSKHTATAASNPLSSSKYSPRQARRERIDSMDSTARRVSTLSGPSMSGGAGGGGLHMAFGMLSRLLGFGCGPKPSNFYQPSGLADSMVGDSDVLFAEILISVAYASRSGTLSVNIIRGRNFPRNLDCCQLRITFLYDGLHGSQRTSDALPAADGGDVVLGKCYQFSLPSKWYDVASVQISVWVQQRTNQRRLMRRLRRALSSEFYELGSVVFGSTGDSSGIWHWQRAQYSRGLPFPMWHRLMQQAEM